MFSIHILVLLDTQTYLHNLKNNFIFKIKIISYKNVNKGLVPVTLE